MPESFTGTYITCQEFKPLCRYTYVILYVFFGKIHEHVVVHLICLCLETERGGIRFT